MEAKHTPGPYHVGDWLEGSRGTPICFGDKKDPAVLAFASRRADAEFIVRTCNTHDDLVAALQRCKFDSLNMTLEDLSFCRAAIAKATGEPA